MIVDWKWLEKQIAGCKAAWIELFGDDTTGYQFGVTGSRKQGTYKILATDREAHYGKNHPMPLARIQGVGVDCNCRVYCMADKRWKSATHSIET